jgi:hypothetical protein
MSNQRTHPIPIKRHKPLTVTPSNISPTISPKNSKLKRNNMYCDIFPGQPITTTLDNSQKVWALGYDLFQRVTKGKKFLEKEEDLMSFSLDEPLPIHLDEKLEFWHFIMDSISTQFLDICQMDCLSTEKQQFCYKVYHSGILYMLLRNPVYLPSYMKKVETDLKEALESDKFWDFNPIQLVSTLLWCRSLHVKAMSLLTDKSNASFDEILELIPFQELPFVEEQEVCEQDLAIDYVEYQIAEKEPEFIDLLTLVSASILGSALDDGFSLDTGFTITTSRT